MSEAKVWIWSPISLRQAVADSSYLQPLSAMKTGCSRWLGKAGLLSLSAAAAWGSRAQVWGDAAGCWGAWLGFVPLGVQGRSRQVSLSGFYSCMDPSPCRR